MSSLILLYLSLPSMQTTLVFQWLRLCFSGVDLMPSWGVKIMAPWTAACQASLLFTISRSLLKLMSIELVIPSNHLILCCPLLFLHSIFPSIRIFSNESALHIRWPNYWSFSFSISPSNEYPGFIFFRFDWFGFPGSSDSKKSACNTKGPGLIPGWGRSLEKGKPIHSCVLAWRTRCGTQLSN